MDSDIIGTRVREAIERTGMTHAAFAAEAGLDAPKLSKSLAGTRRFTSLDLANIAELAGVTVDSLLGKDPVVPALAARAVGTAAAPVRDAVAAATRYAQARTDLAFLGLRQPGVPSVPAPAGGRWVDEGAALAEAALRRVPDFAAAPAKTCLPDLIEDSFGIDVAVVELVPGCDGLTWHEPDARLIVVSTSPTPTRQRFTLAHELGHLLAGDDQRLHVDEDVMGPDGRRQPTEMRANAFAAAFLMPEETLRRDVHGLPDWPADPDNTAFSGLVMRYAVSPSALAYRLSNLGLIGADQRARFAQLTTTDCARIAGDVQTYVDWAANSARPRPPLALLGQMLSAYVGGETTLRPLANLIGFPVDQLRRELEPRISSTTDADQWEPIFVP